MFGIDDDGKYYVSDKTQNRYTIELGMGVGTAPARTSDIYYIMWTGFTADEYERWLDDEIERENPEEFVGFLYGGDEKYIEEIVARYEIRKSYPFRNEGIIKFGEAIELAAMNELTNERPDFNKLDIKIQVGDHTIVVPQTANNYIGLCDFLFGCREDTIE